MALNRILAQVRFTVEPVSPQTHPLVISPVPKCIIETDIGRIAGLIP